jgi:hypothetical protein
MINVHTSSTLMHLYLRLTISISKGFIRNDPWNVKQINKHQCVKCSLPLVSCTTKWAAFGWIACFHYVRRNFFRPGNVNRNEYVQAVFELPKGSFLHNLAQVEFFVLELPKNIQYTTLC